MLIKITHEHEWIKQRRLGNVKPKIKFHLSELLSKSYPITKTEKHTQIDIQQGCLNPSTCLDSSGCMDSALSSSSHLRPSRRLAGLGKLEIQFSIWNPVPHSACWPRYSSPFGTPLDLYEAQLTDCLFHIPGRKIHNSSSELCGKKAEVASRLSCSPAFTCPR